MTLPNAPTFDGLRNFTQTDIDSLSPETLALLQNDLMTRAEAIQADGELLARLMSQKYSGLADSSYLAKGEDSGKNVVIVDDVYELVMIRGKSVVWDQAKLGEIKDRIRAANDDPDIYIKTETQTKLSVAEAVYKGWPENLKKAFLPARAVKVGETKFLIQPRKKGK